MSAPTVEEVRLRGGFPFRAIDAAVITDIIVAATAMVEDKITAYIDDVGALTISEDEEKRLILLIACQKCITVTRNLESESGGGQSSSFTKDAARFQAEFHNEWIRLAGMAGGQYAIRKGWL